MKFFQSLLLILGLCLIINFESGYKGIYSPLSFVSCESEEDELDEDEFNFSDIHGELPDPDPELIEEISNVLKLLETTPVPVDDQGPDMSAHDMKLRMKFCMELSNYVLEKGGIYNMISSVRHVSTDNKMHPSEIISAFLYYKVVQCVNKVTDEHLEPPQPERMDELMFLFEHNEGDPVHLTRKQTAVAEIIWREFHGSEAEKAESEETNANQAEASFEKKKEFSIISPAFWNALDILKLYFNQAYISPIILVSTLLVVVLGIYFRRPKAVKSTVKSKSKQNASSGSKTVEKVH